MIKNDRMGPIEVGERQSASANTSSASEASLASQLEEFLVLVRSGRRPTREEFLASHAPGNAALAECLDGLEFLLSAAPALVEALPEPSESSEHHVVASSRLGDYRIVREVGRGGMGVVYEAEQVSLGRRVALKILPFGAALDPRKRQRFRLEAQAAAHLHHPHIVPVYAFGRDQGVHFFAMQFIEGGSLAAVLQDLRRHHEVTGAAEPDSAPARSESQLSAGSSGFGTTKRDGEFFRRVAEIGLQAAEGLEHAHALGVIHRDVKPGNLLIDTSGSVWVADFGLARLLDEPGLTRTGDLLGTIAYMSPEQAEGRRALDHRTDVYSLGATLYELATLQPPFQGRDRQELLRKIANEEPAAPRHVNASIPRDLQTIILKAMEKEPAARYPTAQAMAEDLGRFLRDAPILARRPSPLERGLRWVRRNRTLVTTLLILAVLALAASHAWVYRESVLNRRAYDRLQTELARQRDLVRQSTRAADLITYSAMYQLQMLNPAGGSEDGGFYRQALVYYENVAAQDWDDPGMRATKAAALRRIGFIRMILRFVKNQPDFQDADSGAPYDEAIRLSEEVLLAEPENPEVRLDFADLLGDVAEYRKMREGVGATVPLRQKSLAILQPLVDARRNVPRLLERYVSTGSGLAAALHEVGRTEEATKLRASLVSVLDRIDPPTASGVHKDAAMAEVILAGMLGRPPLEDREEAALRLRRALRFDPGSHRARNALAWLLAARPEVTPHDPVEAISLAREALAGRDDPAIWNTLGVALYRQGELPAAREALQRGMKRTGGVPTVWLFLALIEAREGHRDAARSWFDRAVNAMKARSTSDPELARFRLEAEQALRDEGTAPAVPR